MNKFTPGPWKIIPGFSKMKVYVGLKHIDCGCIADCDLFDIANDTEAATIEKEANAQLIASAPQMLEALEELVELKDKRHSLPVEIYQESREKAWNKCRAAIAAAKGEV